MTDQEIDTFVNCSKLRRFRHGPPLLDYLRYPSLTVFCLDIPEMGGDIIENYGHRMEEILLHTSEEKLGLIPFSSLSSVANKLITCSIRIKGNGDFIFRDQFQLKQLRFL